MNLREYFNEQITNYCIRHGIIFQQHTSKFSDYYYITNIQGRNGHTLKIRVSNHPAWQKHEIPFLNFMYASTLSNTYVFQYSQIKGSI